MGSNQNQLAVRGRVNADPAEALPTKPSLPEGLKSLLNSGKKALIGDDGEIVIDDDWHPPVVDDKQRAWIEAKALPQLDAYLAPAEGVALTARVTVLLSHWFVASMPKAAWSMLIDDWRKALADLPMWAINAACEKWFETAERRPAPAAIRRLSKEALAGADEERQKLRAIISLPPPANELVATLTGKLHPISVEKWIAPLSLTVIGDMAVVRCPSRFHRDWVRTHYGDSIALVQRHKGRTVHILALDEPDPKQVSPEDLARMKARLKGMAATKPVYGDVTAAECP